MLEALPNGGGDKCNLFGMLVVATSPVPSACWPLAQGHCHNDVARSVARPCDRVSNRSVYISSFFFSKKDSMYRNPEIGGGRGRRHDIVVEVQVDCVMVWNNPKC